MGLRGIEVDLKDIECVRKYYGSHYLRANDRVYRVEKDHGGHIGYRIFLDKEFVAQVRAKSFKAALAKVLREVEK